jgi:arylsulfatase A-like enzyme
MKLQIFKKKTALLSIKKLSISKHLTKAVLFSACLSTFAYGEQKPNIVFILADDLGYNQIGANGGKMIKTPNIDQLAVDGIRFTQAYSGNTVCSPSRVSLMTGRDGRFMENNSNTVKLKEIDVTIADVLKHASYDTALFGKYSIGYEMGVTDPQAKGFDTWYGMFGILEGHRQYPYYLWRDGKRERVEANEGGKKGAYAQELFTNEAINYIEQKHDNPFFVMVNYTTPHGELGAPKKYVDMYDGKFEETPYSGMSTGTPSDRYARYYPEPIDNPNATLAGMVTALDDYVGQLKAALKKKGVLDNTIIIFTSDNGPHDEGGADPLYMKAAQPYKGQKRDLYDGGIHVPMIVHWPAGISKPRVDATPWAFADVLPTFADLAGVNLRTVAKLRSNGVSIRGLLQDTPEQMAERTLYWEFGKQAGDANSGIIGDVYQAARRGHFKAVRYTMEGAVELYNIETDPGETNELSQAEPEVYQEFVALFKKHQG